VINHLIKSAPFEHFGCGRIEYWNILQINIGMLDEALKFPEAESVEMAPGICPPWHPSSLMRRGFPSPPNVGDELVTNIGKTVSPFWRAGSSRNVSA